MNEAQLETISNILDDILKINSDIIINQSNSFDKISSVKQTELDKPVPPVVSILDKLLTIRERTQKIRSVSISILELL